MELEELRISQVRLIQAIEAMEASGSQKIAISEDGQSWKISIKPILREAIVYR